VLTPRDGVVLERRVAPAAGGVDGTEAVHHFELAEGPVARYERTVTVAPPGAGGLVPVRQAVSFRVGVPFVSWLFAPALRANLGGLAPAGRSPWWAPPQRMAHRSAVTLAALCGLSVLAGYLDGLLPSTMTYAGREFGVGDTGQGIALGAVQLSSVLALALLSRADRSGRRTLILVTTVTGAAVSAAGALSPSIAVLTATQVAAGALLTAQYVLLGVMVIEDMPAGSRAWALALLTMCFGFGGGITLLVLPLAGAGRGGWRWLYVVAVLAVPAVAGCARHLPESERWRLDADRRRDAAPSRVAPRHRWRDWTPQQRRRLLVIGAGALLFALFDAPAGQFQNQYLRTERHWSAARISVAEQITGTIGGVGTLVGGRLADTHGRRPVAAVAVGLGAAVTLLQYFTHGAALYGSMAGGSLLAYAVVPALAVYGGELFPTALRGRAGGALTVLAATGGLVGLGVTGVLASAIGTIGPALAVLTVGPILLVVLVARAYPETAGRTLEEMNPGDAPAEPDRSA
jgi:MFS family permease